MVGLVIRLDLKQPALMGVEMKTSRDRSTAFTRGLVPAHQGSLPCAL